MGRARAWSLLLAVLGGLVASPPSRASADCLLQKVFDARDSQGPGWTTSGDEFAFESWELPTSIRVALQEAMKSVKPDRECKVPSTGPWSEYRALKLDAETLRQATVVVWKWDPRVGFCNSRYHLVRLRLLCGRRVPYKACPRCRRQYRFDSVAPRCFEVSGQVWSRSKWEFGVYRTSTPGSLKKSSCPELAPE